jgi:BCD family chlorophyll transporter-like MFS transporter
MTLAVSRDALAAGASPVDASRVPGLADVARAGAGPSAGTRADGLSWFGIIRLGLVQTALGAIVVLTTSTLNRIMVVELQLAALVPGFLVTLHYALQALRPRWGYGSDRGGRRTRWILAGMAILAAGATLAAVSTALMAVSPVAGVALAALAFAMVGIGVGAAGTSLLVLLADEVAEPRRAGAATTVWLMMIAGFVVTSIVAGALLKPFSFERLVLVVGGVCVAALVLATLAIVGVETGRRREPDTRAGGFLATLARVWAEPQARAFTIFIFFSMLAYSTQDLILEPYAGLVFGMSPGDSTMLGGAQHGGVFAGMVVVPLLCLLLRRTAAEAFRSFTIFGCLASGAALVAIALGASVGPAYPLAAAVFALGFFNGVFAVAAIAAMMSFAREDGAADAGTRMGVWGAAQAFGFGIGNIAGAGGVDLARGFVAADAAAYQTVFIAEAGIFLAAALLAWRAAPARFRNPSYREVTA